MLKKGKSERELSETVSRFDHTIMFASVAMSCDFAETLAPVIRLRYSWCLMLELAESVRNSLIADRVQEL